MSQENELPDFEFFTTQVVNPRETKPVAVITKGGLICFNAPASKQYKIKGDMNVVLGFNQEKRIVGIHIIDEPIPGSRKICHKDRRKRSAAISVVKFLKYFGITETGRFPLSYDETNRTLYFSLKNERI